MNISHIIIEFITFSAVTGSVMYIYSCLDEKYRRSVIMKRLFASSQEAKRYEKRRTEVNIQKILISLGLTAIPKKEEEIRDIKRLLGYAGYRSPDAPTVYFGIKLGLALLLSFIYFVIALSSGHVGLRMVISIFFPAALGYYLPGLFLKHKVSLRHRQIFKELPDAFDLLLICMEAGLSFDMALYRVSRELTSIAPVLSKEFSQYFLEIKGGLPRKQVLKDLAERNGEKNLMGIVQVLIQSAEFGTDVAETIRVYSESLRTERKQIAEEKAGKIATKMTFPMILFILPALMIIILGPAVINLLERLG